MQAHLGAYSGKVKPAGPVRGEPHVATVHVEPNSGSWRQVEIYIEVTSRRIVVELVRESMSHCSPSTVLCLALSMPKTPKGHKRPADVVSNAVRVMQIATGEAEESGLNEDGKSKAAVELGRMGGQARAKALSKKRQAAIAKKAALTRWAAKGR